MIANIQSLWAFVVCLSCGDHEQNIPLSVCEEQIAMCVKDRTHVHLLVSNIWWIFRKEQTLLCWVTQRKVRRLGVHWALGCSLPLSPCLPNTQSALLLAQNSMHHYFESPQPFFSCSFCHSSNVYFCLPLPLRIFDKKMTLAWFESPSYQFVMKFTKQVGWFHSIRSPISLHPVAWGQG